MVFRTGNQLAGPSTTEFGGTSGGGRPYYNSRPTNGEGRSLLTETQWRSVAALLGLSGREFQIVQCIFDDMKEATIARELSISAHTVHTHVERLYRKTGVSNRCALLVRIFAVFLSSVVGNETLATPVTEKA